MSSQNIIRLIAMAAFIGVAAALPQSAHAWSSCGETYVVQWGDTLGSIAGMCGTSVEALRQANPQVGYWLYAGQTLWMPGSYQQGSGYRGEYGFPGHVGCDGYQRPGGYPGGPHGDDCYGDAPRRSPSPTHARPGVETYVVQRGDSMRTIAQRLGIPVWDLIAANPQIWNPNLIYPGQIICLPWYYGKSDPYNWDGKPDSRDNDRLPSNMYTIERGESLKDIARKFDLTVEHILTLNPSIKKPSYIHPGMVIRLW